MLACWYFQPSKSTVICVWLIIYSLSQSLGESYNFWLLLLSWFPLSPIDPAQQAAGLTNRQTVRLHLAYHRHRLLNHWGKCNLWGSFLLKKHSTFYLCCSFCSLARKVVLFCVSRKWENYLYPLLLKIIPLCYMSLEYSSQVICTYLQMPHGLVLYDDSANPMGNPAIMFLARNICRMYSSSKYWSSLIPLIFYPI